MSLAETPEMEKAKGKENDGLERTGFHQESQERVLWFESEMASKSLCVKCLVPHAAVFRGILEGDWITRDLTSSIDQSIYGFID
jgi:hypothetical protein